MWVESMGGVHKFIDTSLLHGLVPELPQPVKRLKGEVVDLVLGCLRLSTSSLLVNMILILDHQSGYLRLELIHFSSRSLTFLGAGNCQSSDDILDRLHKSGEHSASCWPSALV